jgi:ABC-type multidrug transport system ATPase subunit
MTTVVSVSQLQKKFGSFQALQDINFQVHSGDVFGFLGPNGAGKSTAMRCMLGLIRADHGDIRIFNQSLQINKVAILGRIGNIIEKPDFYKYLSAEVNLKIFARMANHSISTKSIHEILDFVGLLDRRKDKVKGFSHGMRQRLGIAQTLLANPDLIVLDEPTTGLDPQGIIDVRELILRLKHEKGKTIILSSHQLQEVELIANRMVIINQGHTVVEGEVSTLLNEQDCTVKMSSDNNAKVQHLLETRFFTSNIQHENNDVIIFPMKKEKIPTFIEVCVQDSIGIFEVESKKQLENYFIQMIQNETV